MIHFTLYSRSYCHLCDDMLAALQSMMIAVPFDIAVIDVDGDERLVEQYDELVPVLTARVNEGAEQTLCHYFIDRAAISALMAAA